MPESGDSHWGQLQWSAVPGYVWTEKPGFDDVVKKNSGSFYTDASTPEMPYLNGGGYGDFQTAQPAGRYAMAYQWSETDWTPMGRWTAFMGSSSSSSRAEWVAYAHQTWPNLVDQTGTLNPLYSYTQGCFYTDSTQSRIIMWQWYSGKEIDYYTLWSSQGSGIDYISLTSVPCSADGQPHWTYNYSTGSITIQTAMAGYVPIGGCYDEIVAITKKNGNITGSTVRQHLLVTNPGATAVTFVLNSAQELYNYGESDSGNLYFYTFNVPGNTQGTVTIQPGQTADLTSDFTLPQDSYKGYAAPLTFNSGSKLAPDFGVGAVRPMSGSRYLDWTAGGIRTDIVGYDQGSHRDYYGDIDNVSNTPGFNGGMVDSERAMTAQELASFMGRLTSQTNSKINAVTSNGYTTWGAHATYVKMSSKDGYASYTVLVP